MIASRHCDLQNGDWLKPGAVVCGASRSHVSGPHGISYPLNPHGMSLTLHLRPCGIQGIIRAGKDPPMTRRRKSAIVVLAAVLLGDKHADVRKAAKASLKKLRRKEASP